MTLDRYEMLSELGRGGFGVVYKARQLTTGQPVAIKMLHGLRGLSKDAQQRQLARFEREMRLCAQLHHPNIVRLIDSGAMDDGSVYTAFEYIPGQNLAAFLAEHGALKPVEARHLMLQVLDALSCAHSHGVIHRDLKPANIMVSTTGARPNALVLDFGLGTLVHGPELQDHAKLTGTRELLGTPSYAAPEQLRGQNPTPASDFFSWGLVFLECLTGLRPIRGRTLEEIIFQQLSPAPIPIPPELEAHPLGKILARLLSKDVQERGALKGEKLLRDIEACDLRSLKLSGLGVRVRVSTPGGQQVPTGEKDAPTVTWELQNRPSPPKPSGDASQPKHESDRRQLTALCCTLTVSSTLPKGLDLEESDELIRLGQQLCIEIGQSFGGSLGGILVDQILLYFGLATTPPEGAQRAAQAALEIHQGVRKRNAHLEQQRQVHLEVRASIHTGHVVVRGPGHVVGATPKAAAQLSACTPPWEITVSADTAPLLQSRFALECASWQQDSEPGLPEMLRLRGERCPA